MTIYSLEYERWLRDPRISEAVDNCELSTLYEWMWEYLENERLGKRVVGEISKLPESD
jgi:hypothetical protein